jgi:hypothetical protein
MDTIPYEQALALKELGFDGRYFLDYDNKGNITNDCEWSIALTPAPTFSQAFRWFREKYNFPCKIEASQKDLSILEYHYFYQIMTDSHIVGFGIEYNLTYEEAELECLKKLIEIVK